MSQFNQQKPYPKGELIELQIDSEILKDNRQGDPHRRKILAYLPPDYRHNNNFPVFYYLAAYSNSAHGVTAWKNFSESIPERLDRLIAEQKIGSAVMVFPDCFTSLGGNQYINSKLLGRYADYLHHEVVSLAETELSIKTGAAHRAVLGKSSGGFAAIRSAIDFPGFWSAIANHSGDCGFAMLYQRDFPAVADVLAQFNYDVDKFIKRFWKAKKIMGSHILVLMHLCMAATYSDTLELPFDLHDCRLKPQLWQQWLAHDPVNLIDKNVAALKQLNGLYLDCGYRDQYFIHYGMRQLVKQLEKHHIEHNYSEFNGSHSGIDYRLDESLPFLYQKIS